MFLGFNRFLFQLRLRFDFFAEVGANVIFFMARSFFQIVELHAVGKSVCVRFQVCVQVCVCKQERVRSYWREKVRVCVKSEKERRQRLHEFNQGKEVCCVA